jgi:hypothetical protein
MHASFYIVSIFVIFPFFVHFVYIVVKRFVAATFAASSPR